MASVTSRMYKTAAAVGLPLDKDLSCVQRTRGGTVCVIASVDAFPESEDQRRFSQSALHAALLEDLSDIPNLDVRVFMPPVSSDWMNTAKSVKTLASQRIRAWNGAVHDLAIHTTTQFVHSSYNCVVDSYPWLDEEEMRAKIPMAIELTLTNMMNGSPDPFMTNGCVDRVLPTFESIFRSDDERILVYHDVARVLGGIPKSRLQFYEVLYLCVTHRVAVTDTTLRVYERVFRPSA